MPKIVCTTCESDNFENIDGFYYCSVCGSQSKNVCDIELSDEELAVTGNENQLPPVKEAKVRLKENYEIETSVARNFSTFEVYNHLLRRQCDDLVKNGVDSIIKEVVLKLWVKYLQKLEIAFVENESEQINLKNVKWKRDKNFFEIYHLDLCHSKDGEILKNELEQNDDVSFDFGMTSESEMNTEEDNKMIVDTKNEFEQDLIESDEESVKNEENFFEEQLNNSNDLSNEVLNNILLTKFEWIRMPHTIVLLNLGLLMIKSQFLITDLIRLMYNGKVSYFNIDEVLPAYMEFNYKEDSSMFNHLSVPQADYLRMLTSKLGKYLEIDEIELIELKRVSSRYVLDLNLPNELISVVDLLMEKETPIDRLSIKDAQNENIEAIALSYILVSMIILFFYDDQNEKINPSTRVDKIFDLEKWLATMQNRLANVEREFFGCEFEKVMTVEDLKSLKISNFKQRHKTRTKNYIAQYRRNDIISTLNAPLEHEIESIEKDINNLDINSSLFYISKNFKFNFEDNSLKSVESYLTEEKLNIIGLKHFKSKGFKQFVTETIDPVKLRGRYVLGLETSTLDWLIEVFSHIAQTKTFFQMFNFVIKLLKKFK
ncbi:TATA box-binding -associated factor RNA polymerase I subunit B [Brachionus plicatilis]|uniref:TATA box-binding-associated factor RNA polymerase I subunit B n=1 Tax=Brachionus plicatilis TaxID=10195 RepID=A0A3M7T1P8_BRAPC|nr:TATA box-binding -associated factor RNA polymerase I subunit B [Brachionus plicatilis]